MITMMLLIKFLIDNSCLFVDFNFKVTKVFISRWCCSNRFGFKNRVQEQNLGTCGREYFYQCAGHGADYFEVEMFVMVASALPQK